jgi:alkane 1-monooxygenase
MHTASITPTPPVNTYRQALPYLAGLLPAVLAIAGNLLGGYWAMMNTVFPLVILVLADWLLPKNARKPLPVSATIPDGILLLTVLLHTLAVASLVYGVYAGMLTEKWIWWAAVSTGFNSGIMGITAAHELIHRRERLMQHLGIWNLFLTNYTHFYIEHRLGHHVRVGTWDDPATARYNESVYQFLVRSIPGQWLSALQIEARRLRKHGRYPYSLRNFVVRAGLLQIAFTAALFLVLGPLAGWAYLIQSVLAFVLLEYVNYIEHYGLVRKKGERVSAHHAWQSDAISSRFTLFELSRHSDHHLKAAKPFYTLESHADGYMLPSGYFGMFYIGLIPPLWFRMINPIIDG